MLGEDKRHFSMSHRLSLALKQINNYERRDRMLKRESSLWSTETIFSFPVKTILTNRDQEAIHIFGINPKCLFFSLKSLFFQSAVLLVFRKCRKRQCLEAIFSTSTAHQGLKLTWIFRECVKNLFYKRKDKFLSNVYWEMFIILMFSYILAVATVVARLLLPLAVPCINMSFAHFALTNQFIWLKMYGTMT